MAKASGLDIDGAWLAQWAAVIVAREEQTKGDVSVRVVPDNYQTSPDGRDWYDGPGSPRAISLLAYDEGFRPWAAEQLLRDAVEALDGLPSGMGWRHGELVVSIRTAAGTGGRSRVVDTWVLAKVDGRGLTFTAAPDVPTA